MSTWRNGNNGRRVFTRKERVQILKEGEEFGVNEVCERYGIHFTTWYEWRRKYRREGEAGLETKKPSGRGRKKHSLETWKVEAVLTEWKRNPGFGPSQIVNQLRRQRKAISIRTVTRILREHGYQGRRKVATKSRQRFEASRPLELAQIDILEFYIHKAKVYLVLLLDDYSRFLLGWTLLERPKTEAIDAMLKAAVQRYGKIETVLADRGSVFFSWQGMTRFEKSLEAEGILMTHASPGHPQTLGKIEAVNKSIQKELLRQQEFPGIGGVREAIGEWVERYNYERTHQGLGGLLVPADRFHGRAEAVEKKILASLGTGGGAGLEGGVFEEGGPESRSVPVLQVYRTAEGWKLVLLGKTLWPPESPAGVASAAGRAAWRTEE